MTKTDEVTITNPVTLAPRRTFHEVKQPTSPFTVRFQAGPAAALFESDGGQWQIQAVANIAEWLRNALEGLNILVIA